MSFQRLLGVLVIGCSLLVVWSSMPASGAGFTLQKADATVGNQDDFGVGVRFDVNSPVTVSALGIFDSGQDGIAAPPEDPLTAQLYLLTNPTVDPSAGVVVASMTFDNTSQGTLDLKYRFKPITPVILVPGRYVLAGTNWIPSDQEHNCVIDGVLCETFDNGGGLLTYVDSPFGADSPGTIPVLVVCCTNFFSAANMKFDATSVPGPSTWLLFATGGVGLLGYRRWRAA